MNFQHYANYYANFHGAKEFEIISDCIVYKLAKISKLKDIILKLKNFDKAYDDSNTQSNDIKPLSKSLMKHFKLDTPCTIFKTDDSFSILYGNTLLVYPTSKGFVCAVGTEYFIKEFKIFQHYMNTLKAECVSENIYYYKSAVIYTDPYDIPYPGGDYFSRPNHESKYNRICFILENSDLFRISEFVHNLQNVNNIFHMPLLTKEITTTISRFIDPIPIDESLIPTTHYEYTNIVLKNLCYKNPNFILQDILNSCVINTEIGIVIEYPIQLSYVSLNKTSKPRRYFCFSINCHQPKQIIHVPSPYDRYYRYNYGLKDAHWTTLYYNFSNNVLPSDIDMLDVVIDTNTIGYVYNNTFFCLSHPILSKVTKVKNKNTRFILNTLTFNIENDENLNIVYMHRFDLNFIIYCVKHKNLPYDMWCLEKSKHNINNYRTTQLPYLVINWINLVADNQSKENFHFDDLNFIKLMYILSRHNICFNAREGKTRDIIFQGEETIIFQAEKNAINFINSVRLSLMQKDNSEGNNNDNSCVIT